MKEIILTNGKKAFVDDENFEFLNRFTWSERKDGYAVTQVSFGSRNSHMRMHRAILLAPEWALIDHRNGNRLDNRICNLRFCSNAQNVHNSLRKRGRTSRFKGVTHHTRGKYSWWRARLTYDQKTNYLGCFKTEQAAHEAVVEASKRIYGEFSPYHMAALHD
jgi:hypothetical protein